MNAIARVSLVSLLLVTGSVFAQGPHGSGDPGAGGNHGSSGSNGPGLEGWNAHQLDHNLVLPQFAVGESVSTTVVMGSLGNALRLPWVSSEKLVIKGRVLFFDQDGEALEVNIRGVDGPVTEYGFLLNPSEVRFLEISRDGRPVAGWLLIEVDDQDETEEVPADWGVMDGIRLLRGARLLVSAYYTITGTDGNVETQVAVRPSLYVPFNFKTAFLPVQLSPGVNTGIAVVNTGSEGARVRVRLRNSAGRVVEETVLGLPAGSQIARYVDELFEGDAEFRGILEAETDAEGIVVMGLLQTGRVLTSLPVHHFGRWSRE